MISLNKHEISTNIKDRYATIIYLFHFENMNKNGSNELQFEITIAHSAFISRFEANIDGEIFVGQTKEKETAAKEYNEAKKKNENAIIITQPYKNIPNAFQIKTNIDAKSKVLLTIEIEEYLQKKFDFNELSVQILRNFGNYIKQNFDHISFSLTIEDRSGIYDISVPTLRNGDTIIDEQIMNDNNQKCEIIGKIMQDQYKTEVKQDEKWKQLLKVKDKVDVLDRNKWYIGQVIEIKDEKQIKIHYIGFDDKYDEYIELNSDRFATLHSHTTNIKSNELVLKYKTKGEKNDSCVLFDKATNTFCHIVSDIISDSIIDEKNDMNIDDKSMSIPRRVVFVIDKSGSMGGIKWIKTVDSTIMALKELRYKYDRFGVILFHKEIELLLNKNIILADEKSITAAVNTLENAGTGTSTNINDALLKAIDLIKNDIKLLNNNKKCEYNFFMNQIIFLTDGEPNEGESNTKTIMSNVQNANNLSDCDKYNNKISIFSFGIGNDGNDSKWINDLNHSFLKLLSVNNNGFYQRIKQSLADTVLMEYFSILSKPMFSNINISYANKNIKDLTQCKFNTLYAGNDLIICGKIDNKLQNNNLGSVTITAITGQKILKNDNVITKPINISKNIIIEINSNNYENAERIWAYLTLQQFATQKLIYSDMIEIDDDEKIENEKVPLELALKHQFVTPWTSMIVVKKKNKQSQEQTNIPTSAEIEAEEKLNLIPEQAIHGSLSGVQSYRKHCHSISKGYSNSGYHSVRNYDDEDIEPQERYSSTDVICAAEALRFKQQQVKHLARAECAQKSSRKPCVLFVIGMLLIICIVIIIVVSIAFTVGFN